MLAPHLHIEWDFSHAAPLGPEKLLGSMSLAVESTRREVLKENTEQALGKEKPNKATAPSDSHLQEHIQPDGSALT